MAVESFECVQVSYLSDTNSDGIIDMFSRDVPPIDILKGSLPSCTTIDTGELGFKIPSLGDLLTFAIRAFFVIAGLAALFYLLLGALAWVTSGGDKDAVTAAREKIQAAVLGMILIVAVLAIIWTLEQVIFNRRICLGLSCPLTLPGLIETTDGGKLCCTCLGPAGNLCTTTPATDPNFCAGTTADPIVINALSDERCAN